MVRAWFQLQKKGRAHLNSALTLVAAAQEAPLRVVAGSVVATARGVQSALVNVEAVLVGLREAREAGAYVASGRVAAGLVAGMSAFSTLINVCSGKGFARIIA